MRRVEQLKSLQEKVQNSDTARKLHNRFYVAKVRYVPPKVCSSKAGTMKVEQSALAERLRVFSELLNQIDIVGLFLLGQAFALFLLPFSSAYAHPAAGRMHQ